MPAPSYVSEAQALITITVNGTPYREKFADFSGGNLKSESGKVFAGGMDGPVTLPGTKSIEDVKVIKPVSELDDLHAIGGWLDQPAVVSVQRLDSTKSPKGRARLYAGRIIEVATPEISASGNDGQKLELTVAVDGDSIG